jgi:hypothetical protein
LQATATYGSSTGSCAAFKMKKTVGDTTLTLSWTGSKQYVWLAAAYSGLNATTPVEGWAWRSITGAANIFTTSAATPTGNGRKAFCWFGGADSNFNTTQETWTTIKPLSQIAAVKQDTWTHPFAQICDTSSAVVTGPQQFTSVVTPPGGGANNNGFAAVVFLVPA